MNESCLFFVQELCAMPQCGVDICVKVWTFAQGSVDVLSVGGVCCIDGVGMVVITA